MHLARKNRFGGGGRSAAASKSYVGKKSAPFLLGRRQAVFPQCAAPSLPLPAWHRVRVQRCAMIMRLSTPSSTTLPPHRRSPRLSDRTAHSPHAQPSGCCLLHSAEMPPSSGVHRLKARRVVERAPWHPRCMTNALPVVLRRDRCLPRTRLRAALLGAQGEVRVPQPTASEPRRF